LYRGKKISNWIAKPFENKNELKTLQFKLPEEKNTYIQLVFLVIPLPPQFDILQTKKATFISNEGGFYSVGNEGFEPPTPSV
tara:strand:+ start:12718 stop:12963 length:246 start_codon:yes stop_codon:yes gene_type:complete